MDTITNNESIQSTSDYDDTPAGKYKYWSQELNSSKKSHEKWWRKADKIVNRYLGESSGNGNQNINEASRGFDLNMFHSNIKTLSDMLYGSTPRIDVSRRYAQPKDDVGRVAAEMMERLLNLDVAENGAEIDAVFRSTLQDRLLTGLGCAKVRYEVETENVPLINPEDGMPILDETGEPLMEEKLVSETAPTEYYYWGDILWGWCRNWAQMPWIGFRSYMTQDELRARWGDDVADNAPLKKQTKSTSDEGVQDPNMDSAWMRAEVWEIWCKKTRTVHWLILGYDKQLEEKPDILGLSGFWPCPPFFIANVTTTLYTPTPDFIMAQDLYNEVDKLQTRIAVITEAVRVVGVYNASADNLKSMFNAGKDNDLIPVENWALFGENGGLAGQIEWVPIVDIVQALNQLIQIRDQTIGLLQQITGMVDVMRGSLDNQYEGVGQTEQKTKFGSVRIQALQEQFARFGGDLMQIKAEVIARHFSPETIYKRANMQFSMDEEYVADAIELIKTPEDARLRIDIRPESVAMIDYQSLKGERTEYMNAVSTYMQSASGIISEDPAAKPFVLQLLQWGLAGFKGSSEIEGVLDKAIDASMQASKKQEGQEQPSPEQIAAQEAKSMEEMKQQGDIRKIQVKAQADVQVRTADMQADVQTAQETHVRKMAEIQAALQAKIAEVQVSLQADLLMEKAQAESNIMQTNATVDGEIKKDVVEAQIDMQKEETKTQNALRQIAESASADIQKSIVAETLKLEVDGDA
tara:strand:- start:194 stop:2443 length:2250 start_codon:yes stop_codon:yes gene_type:complete